MTMTTATTTEATTDMLRLNVIAGILALLLFAHAQNQGWNLFERDGQKPSRLATSSRTYHK